MTDKYGLKTRKTEKPRSEKQKKRDLGNCRRYLKHATKAELNYLVAWHSSRLARGH